MKPEYEIDAETLRKALGASMANPVLQKMFKSAPQGAKPILKLKFAASVFPEKISDELFSANLENLTRNLGVADLEFLVSIETDSSLRSYFASLLPMAYRYSGNQGASQKAGVSEIRRTVVGMHSGNVANDNVDSVRSCAGSRTISKAANPQFYNAGNMAASDKKNLNWKKDKKIILAVAVVVLSACAGMVLMSAKALVRPHDIAVPEDVTVNMVVELDGLVASGECPDADGCYWLGAKNGFRIRKILSDGRVVVAIKPASRDRHAIDVCYAVIRTEQECVDGGSLSSGLYKYLGVEHFDLMNDNNHAAYCFNRIKPAIEKVIIGRMLAKEEERRFKEEQARQTEELKQKEMALMVSKKKLEHEHELAKERLEKERQLAERKRQLDEDNRRRDAELAEAKRQMMIAEKEAEEKARAKAAAEAAAAYPKIQAERKAYAQKVLSEINVDVNDLVLIDPYIKRFVGIRIGEKSWARLISALKKSEWLVALSEMDGNELKEYPEMENIDSIVASFFGKKYTLEIKYVTKEAYHMLFAQQNFARLEVSNGKLYAYTSSFGSPNDDVICQIDVRVGYGPYLFYHKTTEDGSFSRLNKHEDSYESALNNLNKQIKMGNVPAQDVWSKRRELHQKYVSGLLSRMGINAPMSAFSRIIDQAGGEVGTSNVRRRRGVK